MDDVIQTIIDVIQTIVDPNHNVDDVIQTIVDVIQTIVDVNAELVGHIQTIVDEGIALVLGDLRFKSRESEIKGVGNGRYGLAAQPCYSGSETVAGPR